MSDQSDFNFRRLEILALVFAVLAFGLFISSIIFFSIKTTPLDFHSNLNTAIWADLGNFLSGLVGSIFSIVTVILIYMTYRAEKKELEATRKVMVEQSNALKKQQFENSFFKMLDIHSQIMDRFEVNLPPQAELNSWATSHQWNMSHYKYYMTTKKIIGSPLFNYDPFRDAVFKYELLGKILDDINHIGGFILSKSFLIDEEKQFYFKTFFNILFDAEKYFYGIQSDLKIEKFANEKSAEINRNYNVYYNQLEDGFKIKQTDKNNFYPPIIFSLKDGKEQENIHFTHLPFMHHEGWIQNNHSAEISLGEIKITNLGKIKNGQDYLLKSSDEVVLKPGKIYILDFYNFINKFFFSNTLGTLDTARIMSDQSTAVEALKILDNNTDPLKKTFILSFSIKISNTKEFIYYAELLFDPPHDTNFPFSIYMVNSFNEKLLNDLMTQEP